MGERGRDSRRESGRESGKESGRESRDGRRGAWENKKNNGIEKYME